MNGLHLHFGIGDLGIGAVLPVLSTDMRVVFVQILRSEGFAWRRAVKNGTIYLARQIQPEGSYPHQRSDQSILPCQVHEADSSLDEGVLSTGDKKPLVVMVKDIAAVAPLMPQATSISCALRGGQADLAELLLNNDRDVATERPVLAFENTPDDDLQEICHNRVRSWKLFPVITDRICGHREVADPRFGRVVVPCERYLRMITAKDERVRRVFRGELLTEEGRGSDQKAVRLVDATSLSFHRSRKRWLVNSLHEVIGLFSASMLRQNGLPLEDQYLPQTIEWSMSRDVTLQYAVSLFIRLQALRLVFESEGRDVAIAEFYGTTSKQHLYDTFVGEAHSTLDRMRRFSDLIGRLINAKELKKELAKYKEHVRQSMEYVRNNRARFRAAGILGGPDVEEISELRELLERAFDSLSD